jgi:hypothetical protein
LQEVEAVAGRVILINAGRVVFDGLPSEMAAHGRTMDEAFYALTGQVAPPRQGEEQECAAADV